MKYKKLLSMLALLLAICLMFAACGGGDEDVYEDDADENVEDVAIDDEEEYVEEDAGFDLTQLASDISTAAMGVTEAGETIYFAEQKDSEYGILLFYDVELDAHVSYVGPISANGSAITIEDYVNGYSFTFTMEAAEGDAVLIDTGDSGYAIMQECDPIEVLEAMQSIADYSEALA